MNNRNKKTIFYYGITLVVLLLIITVIISTFRNLNKTSGTKQTSIQYVKFTNAQKTAEGKAFYTMENKVKDLLIKKNGWNSTQFEVNEQFIDGKYYVGKIISKAKEVKNGIVLASMADDNWKLIFDSTSPSPCSLLTGEREYLKYVIDACNK